MLYKVAKKINAIHSEAFRELEILVHQFKRQSTSISYANIFVAISMSVYKQYNKMQEIQKMFFVSFTQSIFKIV